MIRQVLLLLLVCAGTLVEAQTNYVLNGSFEQYTSCPTSLDQIRKAKYWTQIDTTDVDPLCSAEYCHRCANDISSVSIPSNFYFHQYPHSGSGLVSAYLFDDETTTYPYRRDYVQGRFFKSLTAGKSYCVTFYVNLAEISTYAISNIGAYFDNGSIDSAQTTPACAQPQTKFTPQVQATVIITDTANWTKIQGQYTATGKEKFITIGNFTDKLHTNFITVAATDMTGSYYLIDDVSVVESSMTVDAGKDGLVSPGSDSAFIGVYEDGLPNTWFIKGRSTPIGYGGGFKVHPDTTTTYIVEMDLCGNVTRDTVTVLVGRTGITINEIGSITLLPNPVKDQLQVIGLKQMVSYRFSDITGRICGSGQLDEVNNCILLGSFSSGVYFLELDSENGGRYFARVVKQ